MNILNKIDPKYHNLLIILAIALFFEPDIFVSVDIVHKIYIIGRTILTVLLGFYYLYRIKDKFNTFFLLITMYFILIFGITISKSGNLTYSLSTAIPIIGILLLVDILIDIDASKLIANMSRVFRSLVYLNLLYIIFLQPFLQSTGDVTILFLGNRNQLAPIIFPAIIFSFIDSYLNEKKINTETILVYAAVVITVILTKSATALIGVFLITVYIILFYKKNLYKYITLNKLLALYLFAFMFIVILRQQDSLSLIIEGFLGKDLSFSTRTNIWDRSFVMIKESPIFGYGDIGTARYIVVSANRARDAHNILLQILLRGGAILLALYTSIILVSTKKINNMENEIGKALSYMIFVLHILMLMEVYPLNTLFVILLLSYRFDDILRCSVQEGREISTPKLLNQ